MQVDTPQSLFDKAWSSNATLSTTVASYVDSSAEPATDSSIARYVCSPPNGVHIVPWLSASGGTSAIRVIGYRRTATLNGVEQWQPTLLGQWTCTHDATAGTTAGVMGALYPAVTSVKNYGQGAALDSVAAQKCPGGFVCDCFGCEKVAIVMTAGSSTPTANMQVAVW